MNTKKALITFPLRLSASAVKTKEKPQRSRSFSQSSQRFSSALSASSLRSLWLKKLAGNSLHWRKLADKKTFHEFTRIRRMDTKKALIAFPLRLSASAVKTKEKPQRSRSFSQSSQGFSSVSSASSLRSLWLKKLAGNSLHWRRLADSQKNPRIHTN
jgi:hypothetical protein